MAISHGFKTHRFPPIAAPRDSAHRNSQPPLHMPPATLLPMPIHRCDAGSYPACASPRSSELFITLPDGSRHQPWSQIVVLRHAFSLNFRIKSVRTGQTAA
jgi:hypothetical protein